MCHESATFSRSCQFVTFGSLFATKLPNDHAITFGSLFATKLPNDAMDTSNKTRGCNALNAMESPTKTKTSRTKKKKQSAKKQSVEEPGNLRKPSDSRKRKLWEALGDIQACCCDACPACRVRNVVLTKAETTETTKTPTETLTKSRTKTWRSYQGFTRRKIVSSLDALEAMPSKTCGLFVHATDSDEPAKKGFRLDVVKHGRRYGQGVYLTLPTRRNLECARRYGKKLVLALVVWSSPNALDEHKPQWVPSADALQRNDLGIAPHGVMFATKPGSLFIEVVVPNAEQVIPLNILPSRVPHEVVAEVTTAWREFFKPLGMVYHDPYTHSYNHVLAHNRNKTHQVARAKSLS